MLHANLLPLPGAGGTMGLMFLALAIFVIGGLAVLFFGWLARLRKRKERNRYRYLRQIQSPLKNKNGNS